jgi:hypothetical protein
LVDEILWRIENLSVFVKDRSMFFYLMCLEAY